MQVPLIRNSIYSASLWSLILPSHTHFKHAFLSYPVLPSVFCLGTVLWLHGRCGRLGADCLVRIWLQQLAAAASKPLSLFLLQFHHGSIAFLPSITRNFSFSFLFTYYLRIEWPCYPDSFYKVLISICNFTPTPALGFFPSSIPIRELL